MGGGYFGEYQISVNSAIKKGFNLVFRFLKTNLLFRPITGLEKNLQCI